MEKWKCHEQEKSVQPIRLHANFIDRKINYYLASPNKGCASAKLIQVWLCSQFALYLTSSKFTAAVYQQVTNPWYK